LSVSIKIPHLLLKYTDQKQQVEVKADNIANCIGELITRFPELKPKLLNERGEIAHWVHLSINQEPVSSDEILKDGDELTILFAVAGG
jgi:molybdopterin converting factor small subunit